MCSNRLGISLTKGRVQVSVHSSALCLYQPCPLKASGSVKLSDQRGVFKKMASSLYIVVWVECSYLKENKQKLNDCNLM